MFLFLSSLVERARPLLPDFGKHMLKTMEPSLVSEGDSEFRQAAKDFELCVTRLDNIRYQGRTLWLSSQAAKTIRKTAATKGTFLGRSRMKCDFLTAAVVALEYLNVFLLLTDLQESLPSASSCTSVGGAEQ